MSGRGKAGRWHASVTGAIAVTLAAVSGCGSADGSGAGDRGIDGATLGLSATLVQNREDVAPRRLQVKLTNGSDEQLRVLDVRLSWSGLEEVEAADQDVLFGIGQRTDLPVPYGDAICPDDVSADRPPRTPIVALASIESSDGTRREVAVPVDDVKGVLDNLYQTDCRRQFVDAAVRLELAGPWERVDPGGVPTLRGALAVERRASTDPIAILDISGSVLLSLAPAPGVGEPMLTLAPTDRAGSAALEVTGSRCDGHALADSKQTFLFQLQLDIGDGPEGVMIVPPPGAQEAMLQLILDHCGL